MSELKPIGETKQLTPIILNVENGGPHDPPLALICRGSAAIDCESQFNFGPRLAPVTGTGFVQLRAGVDQVPHDDHALRHVGPLKIVVCRYANWCFFPAAIPTLFVDTHCIY